LQRNEGYFAAMSEGKQSDCRVTIAPSANWRQLWRDAITTLRELLETVGLSHLHGELVGAAGALADAADDFPLRVPRGFVARMRFGDPTDPLLLQVLPQSAELLEIPGYMADAVGDAASRIAAGMLHKYAGRALLIASGACAVHCRYCFRRHFPYADETAAAGRWHEAISHLAADPTITEVLLSGGDPLSLATPKLAELTERLAGIPHIRRLRIHTRLPIVLPERVDGELLSWLARLRLPCVMVLHANHANEIDGAVAAACTHLRGAGVTLLNQSVLLRGVNDRADALAELSEALIACGVLPYYLHQLDRVRGTGHFSVDDILAVALLEELRVRLPGYLVPRLVREIAGAPFKVPLRDSSEPALIGLGDLPARSPNL
jgi:EF-P beta-lysylation protein EpmB